MARKKKMVAGAADIEANAQGPPLAVVPTRAAALLKAAEVEERDGQLPQFGQEPHPEELVPIANRKLVENKHSYSHKQFKTDLQQYISLAPHSSLVANVMSKAKGKLLGDPVGELAKLPVLADMLRAQGHGCQLVTLSSAQMLEVLIEVEYKEFLYEQKSKPVGEHQRWDRSKAAKYPVEDGAIYCLGWSFSSATSVRQIGTLIPVSYSDGAHMRSNAAGILLSTVSLDSDHHVVPLTYACLLTNENEHSHTLQLEFSKEMHGEAYDRPGRREISDQDKGMEAAWGKVMTNGSKAFNRARHRGDNVSTTVMKPGGSEARRVYKQAVKALTLPRLEEVKALYSPQAAAYLGQVPDAAQYMSRSAQDRFTAI
ncbi:hypothetical protein CYMTET_6616 [Cymbomonas tetramitiformis]|uniref:Uncharacterized protein n=1 Tax=Cymbomonas tetramitiformis TaxID=36881 RepID=A0AAE0GX31_9CHLO|nr:hypothetical protein CYMTET_6616 [Cymbomonas tetramitiformis]|eukprot:gene18862-biopygen19466